MRRGGRWRVEFPSREFARCLETRARPRRIRQQMRWLSVTGRGFRAGSFFGPTVAQRDALAEVQRALAELRDTRR